jgi:trehalose-6-phosphate synthase
VALAHAFFALASWPSFGAQAAEASAPCIASTISIDLGLGWKTPTASSSNDVIPPSAQLIVAANRLPYVVSEKGGNLVSANAGGGLVSALNSTQARFDWIGWPGSSFEAHRHASARRFIAKIDRKLRLTPIFLSQEEKNLFYNEYANRVLWPGFHGF